MLQECCEAGKFFDFLNCPAIKSWL